jgi:GDP-mannose 6-dehydrogenase
MKVSVFGLGYVGTVSAGCLARDGHDVVGVDVNHGKVQQVAAGKSPVIEPGLDELIGTAVREERLTATVDGQKALQRSDISLICVGTPSNGNGSLHLQHVETVCREIGTALAAKPDYHVVVVRSTVLPGTVRDTLVPILEDASGKKAGTDFGVAMNPEFLREGTAVHDYYHASQIVIGQFDRQSGDAVAELFRAVSAPNVHTTIETAEMVKYVNNAFHALKVVFANEIGNLSKAHDVDGRRVMEILCQDRKLNISPAYLQPGFAFGGSCLPKDVRALVYRAKQRDVECPLLHAVLVSNQQQVRRGIELVEQTGRKNVGVLGLSFKGGTDDVRESPVVPLVETLVGRGYQVGVYDETVDPARLVGANKTFLERELPHIAQLMRPSIEEVMAPAEVVVITNGSRVFHRVPQLIREDQVLIDLAGIGNGHTRIEGSYEGIGW